MAVRAPKKLWFWSATVILIVTAYLLTYRNLVSYFSFASPGVKVTKKVELEPVWNATTYHIVHDKPMRIEFSVYRDGFAEMMKTRNISSLKIPKIIHQTWKDYDVPAQFVDYIKSWLVKNPDWEYWFWTDSDADALIKLRYPNFHQMYRQYGHHMQRADALRYFVLYEFGGWYADLDIKVLRSLDEISRRHYCVIPLEPWGQAIVTWNKVRLSSNAVMAASPRHPFFKRVMDRLPHVAKRRGPSPMLWSTGPFMIEDVITKYEFEGKQAKSGYFHNETVWLANPENFLPVADKTAVLKWKQLCLQTKRRSNDKLRQDYCGYLKKTKYANELPKGAYTTHAWSHTYFGYGKDKMNILKVVPSAKTVSNIIKNISDSRDSKIVKRANHRSRRGRQ